MCDNAETYPPFKTQYNLANFPESLNLWFMILIGLALVCGCVCFFMGTYKLCTECKNRSRQVNVDREVWVGHADVNIEVVNIAQAPHYNGPSKESQAKQFKDMVLANLKNEKYIYERTNTIKRVFHPNNVNKGGILNPQDEE